MRRGSWVLSAELLVEGNARKSHLPISRSRQLGRQGGQGCWLSQKKVKEPVRLT